MTQRTLSNKSCSLWETRSETSRLNLLKPHTTKVTREDDHQVNTYHNCLKGSRSIIQCSLPNSTFLLSFFFHFNWLNSWPWFFFLPPFSWPNFTVSFFHCKAAYWVFVSACKAENVLGSVLLSFCGHENQQELSSFSSVFMQRFLFVRTRHSPLKTYFWVCGCGLKTTITQVFLHPFYE